MNNTAYNLGYESYREQQGTNIFEKSGEVKCPYNKYSSDYYDFIKGWNDRCRDDDEDECYQDSYGI